MASPIPSGSGGSVGSGSSGGRPPRPPGMARKGAGSAAERIRHSSRDGEGGSARSGGGNARGGGGSAKTSPEKSFSSNSTSPEKSPGWRSARGKALTVELPAPLDEGGAGIPHRHWPPSKGFPMQKRARRGGMTAPPSSRCRRSPRRRWRRAGATAAASRPVATAMPAAPPARMARCGARAAAAAAPVAVDVKAIFTPPCPALH